MVPVFYSPGYVGSGYAFDTTRKARWVADSLAGSPIPGIALLEPVPLTWDQVAQVHDLEYVRAIETGELRGLAVSQGFRWDAGLWPRVLSPRLAPLWNTGSPGRCRVSSTMRDTGMGPGSARSTAW